MSTSRTAWNEQARALLETLFSHLQLFTLWSQRAAVKSRHTWQRLSLVVKSCIRLSVQQMRVNSKALPCSVLWRNINNSFSPSLCERQCLPSLCERQRSFKMFCLFFYTTQFLYVFSCADVFFFSNEIFKMHLFSECANSSCARANYNYHSIFYIMIIIVIFVWHIQTLIEETPVVAWPSKHNHNFSTNFENIRHSPPFGLGLAFPFLSFFYPKNSSLLHLSFHAPFFGSKKHDSK